MYSVTQDYSSAMSVLSNVLPRNKTDGQTEAEEGSACQMSMGKWTMRDSNGMKHRDRVGLEGQLKRAEKSPCD